MYEKQDKVFTSRYNGITFENYSIIKLKEDLILS